MDSDFNTGAGRAAPLDVDESVEISIRAENGVVVSADFCCTDGEFLTLCAKTLCAVIIDKPVINLFQMNANAVFYNTDRCLPRDRLYCAYMAVTAAKRAAADWCKKNGVPVLPGQDGCSCG